MQKVKIAVIDNGIDHMLREFGIREKNYLDYKNRKNIKFSHGTTCVLIIQKYISSSEIYSLKVLDEKGQGSIEHLEPALRWCYKRGICVVNLSLGTTHYRDKDKIRKVINYYVNQGMCIIAASSNSGHITFPASFSNVIGVAANNCLYANLNKRRFLGIDVLALSEHTVRLDGENSITQKSNSYAAPFVTALIAKCFSKRIYNNIAEIKSELKRCRNKEIEVRVDYNEPDWISNAQIKANRIKGNKHFYFNVIEGNDKESWNRIDTIITDNLDDIYNAAALKKHIVYLGKENLKLLFEDRFFWSPCRKEYIINECNGTEKELDIPIILCEFCDDLDEICLLTELKRYFMLKEYNIFTVSLLAESALCNIEFIPEESLKEINKVKDFIQLQTCYEQSDGLLLGMPLNKKSRYSRIFSTIEIVIKIDRRGLGYEVTICREDEILMKTVCLDMHSMIMKDIVGNVIWSLSEGENE